MSHVSNSHKYSWFERVKVYYHSWFERVKVYYHSCQTYKNMTILSKSLVSLIKTLLVYDETFFQAIAYFFQYAEN